MSYFPSIAVDVQSTSQQLVSIDPNNSKIVVEGQNSAATLPAIVISYKSKVNHPKQKQINVRNSALSNPTHLKMIQRNTGTEGLESESSFTRLKRERSSSESMRMQGSLDPGTEMRKPCSSQDTPVRLIINGRSHEQIKESRSSTQIQKIPKPQCYTMVTKHKNNVTKQRKKQLPGLCSYGRPEYFPRLKLKIPEPVVPPPVLLGKVTS